MAVAMNPPAAPTVPEVSSVASGRRVSIRPQPLPTRYRAERGPDGEVIVRGVPVFAENERTYGFRKVAYGKAWLVQALEADRKLRATGYKAPMHYGHHDVAVTRERAGHYELESVRSCLYGGQPRWVLFASLVFADEAKLERALADFPYRSVEIAGGDAPDQINSLALLSTEAPYFRFPNLENLTYAVLKDGTSAFAWRTQLMLETDGQKFDGDAGGDAAPAGDAGGDSGGGSAGDGSGGDAFDADSDGYDADSGDDASFRRAAISHLRYANKLLRRHFVADDAGSDKSDKDDGMSGKDASSQDDGGKATQEVGAPVVAAKGAVGDKFTATLQGQVAALQAKIGQMERERENEKTFAALRSDLAPYRLPNLEKELSDRIAKSPEEARAWAAGVKQIAPPTKRADESPDDGATAPPTDAPEVAKYAAFGPEVVREARRLADMYAAAPKGHFIRKQSLASYLAAQPSLAEVQ